MITAASIILGAGGGYLLARFIPDETEWYQHWFLVAATTLLTVTPFTLLVSTGPYTLLPSIIGSAVLSAVAIIGLRAKSVLVLSLAVSASALIGGMGTWQTLLLALIPSAGYLYPRIPGKHFLWFLLVPTIIITWSLL